MNSRTSLIATATLIVGIHGAASAQQAGSARPIPGIPPVLDIPDGAGPQATDVMAARIGIAAGPAEDATSYRPVAARAKPRNQDELPFPKLRSTPSP